METTPDALETPQPTGLRFTVEMAADSLETAEDFVLEVARSVAPAVAFHTGSPLEPPTLVRLARTGGSGGILEQHDYHYLPAGLRRPQVELVPDLLQMILSRFASLASPQSDAVALAARWYGAGVGSPDPVDAYLATWIGLEAIGPLLGKKRHPAGARAPCSVCGNKAGKDRDTGKAGIEHQIKARAPELLQGRTLADLETLRHQIAHALQPVEWLRRQADGLLAELQLVLATGVLDSIAGPSEGRLWRALLPRDFAYHPDARASAVSSAELTDVRPWNGGWLEIARKLTEQTSRVEADGQYVWGHSVELHVRADTRVKGASFQTRYVEFERVGRKFTAKDKRPGRKPFPLAGC